MRPLMRRQRAEGGASCGGAHPQRPQRLQLLRQPLLEALDAIIQVRDGGSLQSSAKSL